MKVIKKIHQGVKEMICFKNGNIHNGIIEEAFIADILVKDGKIKEIGENLSIDAACEIVDATGKEIYPGFVEAHGHIGLDGYGIGYEGMDYNEMNDIVSPQLRGLDGIKAMDPAFAKAASAGVTCVCVGPGSANVLGGTFTTIKTVGKRSDNMVVRDAVAMKCAFGENPKRCYRDKTDSSRMTTAFKLREALAKAREYMNKKDAAGDDITKYPTLTSASKFEPRNKSWVTPGVLAKAGCQVSIITDSPVIPQEYLPLCAGLAVQAGMDPFAALQAITINAAKHAGISERVGSLEVGKDADIVITDGCPFEVSTTVEQVYIDGVPVK